MQLGSDCEGNQIAEAALGPARGERMPPDRKPQRALVANRGWKRSFEDPIPLLRGRQLVTLEDAGNYITKLPRAEHEAAEWQAAMGDAGDLAPRPALRAASRAADVRMR